MHAVRLVLALAATLLLAALLRRADADQHA